MGTGVPEPYPKFLIQWVRGWGLRIFVSIKFPGDAAAAAAATVARRTTSGEPLMRTQTWPALAAHVRGTVSNSVSPESVMSERFVERVREGPAVQEGWARDMERLGGRHQGTGHRM